jgi:ribosome modulation factor
MSKDKPKDTAFHNGRRAALAGEDWLTCPYSKASLARHWLTGWQHEATPEQARAAADSRTEEPTEA